ncbi:MAG: hypothetical protein HQ549_01555 [Candidatus Omnitrophica bacterium]|nr:hypothetical protein [Candidatus Omnitrophota bacterium]
MAILVKYTKYYIYYVLIAALGLFMFRGIFAPGLMSGYDNSFHYYDLYYLANTLIPKYHWISGWSMQGMAGMPIFIDYNQLTSLVMVVLNKVFFLPLNFSYKLMVLFSYVFMGAGFYKFTSFRFGKMPSMLITACLMLQSDIYYDKILVGMWNNFLAIGLFFIFLHLLDKNIKAMTLKKAFLLGLIFASIILVHIYAAIITGIILFIYLIPYVLNAYRGKIRFTESLICSYIIPLSAVMISFYYLAGFFIGGNYFEKLGGATPLEEGIRWGAKSFFGPLTTVTGASTLAINLPVMARIFFSLLGAFLFFKSEKNPNTKRSLWRIFWFVVICFPFFIDLFTGFDWWHKIPLVPTLQMSRFFVYIQLCMYVFAAYGAGRLFKRFGRRGILAAICVILLMFSAASHYNYIARDASRTLEESPQMSDIYKVWDWVNENIPLGRSRIVYQNTIGNVDDPILKRSDAFALSGVFTRIPQIGVSRSASSFPQEKYMRNDQGRIFGVPVKEIENSRIKSTMDRFNASHIVTVEPDLKNKLAKSGFFSDQADFGIFSIFRLKDFRGKWISFEKEAAYEKLSLENQRVKADIRNDSPRNVAFVKIARHPLWRARLNGEPARIMWDEYNLMKLSLPEKGLYRLDLYFDYFNPLWVGISLFSLIIVVVGASVKKA